MKKLPLYLMILIFISVVFAVTLEISSFTDKTNPFNLTFDGTNSYLLNIFDTSHYVNNFSFTLTGVTIVGQDDSNIYNLVNDPSLIGFWDLDGNLTTIKDKKNNGKPKFNLTFDAGNFDSTFNQPSIAGNSDYSIGFKENARMYNNKSSLQDALNSMDNFTISFWLNRTNWGESYGLISFIDGANSKGFSLFGVAANNFQLIVHTIAGEYQQTYVGSGQKNSMWTLRKNSTHYSLYVNNTLISAKLNSTTRTSATTNFSIGARYNKVSRSYDKFLVDTNIDNLVIWNRSLTVTELANIVNALGSFPNNILIKTWNDSILFEQVSPLQGDINININTNLINNNRDTSLNFSASNGVLKINVTTANVSFGLSNCSNDFGIPSQAQALNVSFFDILNGGKVLNYETSFDYGLTVDTQDYNTSFGQRNHSFRTCVYPAWANISTDYFIDYGNHSYTANDQTLNNKTKYLPLTFLEGTTPVTFTVTDLTDSPIEEALIFVLRWDVSENSYTTTEVLETDANGQAVGNLILFDEYYKFNIVVDGVLRLEDPGSQGIKIYSTTRTFRISLDNTEWFDNLKIVFGASTTLTFNNDTNSFTYSWVDPTSQMHQGCLRVIKRNLTRGDTLLSENCVESTSASIVTDIGTQSPGNTYIATGYFKFDQEVITDTLEWIIDAISKISKIDRNGATIFITLFVSLALGLVTISIPAISFIMFGMGLLVSVLTGFLNVSIGLIISILLLGGVYIYRQRK